MRAAAQTVHAATASGNIPATPVLAGTLQRACDCGASAGVSGKCAECAAEEKLGSKANLTVNTPGDRYEEEADQVADRVISGQQVKTITPLGSGRTAALRRQEMVPEEDEEPPQMKGGQVQRQNAEDTSTMPRPASNIDEEETVQTKPATGEVALSTGAPAAAVAVASGGQPLDRTERAYFEPRFGRDLSHVRLHTGAEAGRAASGIGARAYTLRNHIAFAPGQYAPGAAEGRRLLAHELTHTLQQSAEPEASGGTGNDPQRSTASGHIFRAVISNCTPDEETAISEAVDRATTNLGTVITALGERPLSNTTKAALFLAFRSTSEETTDTVKEAYEEIRDELPTDGFSCRHEGELLHSAHCPGNIAGTSLMTQYFGGVDVSVCIPDFTELGELARANNVIHESSHRHQQTDDEGYFSGEEELESTQTAGLSPSDRLDNADSYAAFIHYVSNVPAATIEARAKEYRGENLTISPSVGGPVDLNSTDPTVPTFSITGIPVNSGFAFRWVVDIDGDRWRMWSSSGDVFRWGPSSSAYINTPSRLGIAATGATTGKVLCRVRPWRGAELADTILLEHPVVFST